MNFVNPLYLLGTMVAAVPILLHLMKRTRARREEFPSLMFLRRISRKYIRFQKLRHLFLLLIRVSVLILLALAFSRPYVELPAGATVPGPGLAAHIILLDDSLSMGYEDRWTRAKSEATQIAAGVRSGDRVALLHFSDVTRVAVPPTMDPAQVSACLDRESRLSDRPTRYAQALRVAEKIALDTGIARRTIHIISDFQRTGLAADEQGYSLDGRVKLEVHDLGQGTFSNLAVVDAQIGGKGGTGTAGSRLKATVLCYGGKDRPGTRVVLMVDGRRAGESIVDLPAGAARGVEFGLPVLGRGPHTATVQVDDPSLTRDNSFLLKLDVDGKRPVVAVGLPAGTRRFPGAFLEAAINAPALSPFSLVSMPIRQFEVSDGVPAGVLIWNAAAPAGDRVREKLEAYVRDGGGLAVVAEDSGASAAFNRVFSNWLPVRLTPATEDAGVGRRPGDDFRLLTDMRMDHPVFLPFRESGASAFSTTKFYRRAHLSVSGGAQVLAGFDDGDPALVYAAHGKGRVLLFCSSVDDSGNDLPLVAVYAPFWQQMLRFLENFREDRLWYLVGETAAPRRLLGDAASTPGTGRFDAARSIAVLDPGRRRVPIDAASDSIELDQAGLYEIRSEGASTAIAVNVPPVESDLTHADAEELAAAWTRREVEAGRPGGESDPASPEEKDRHRNLWRLLLLAVVGLLAGEGFLSNRLVLRQE